MESVRTFRGEKKWDIVSLNFTRKLLKTKKSDPTKWDASFRPISQIEKPSGSEDLSYMIDSVSVAPLRTAMYNARHQFACSRGA